MTEQFDEIRPFRIDVPQDDLDDLRQRLARTRWTDDIPGTDWDYGVPASYLRELVEYWLTCYDWRAAETELNSIPQFTTWIDGQRVHFLHVRSPEPDPIPLILSHGWPGTVLEYSGLISALSNPRADGADPSVAFDVVIPSLPGSGFSGPTRDPGWDCQRIARAWAVLMSRLGYESYGAAGNDWGGVVTQILSRADPHRLIGMHVTQLLAFPDGDEDPAAMPSEEQAALADLATWQQTRAAYYELQSQQPQTLAHALADSPAGLLGWVSQILGPELDRDFVLSNVMIHWLTRTAGSAMRVYCEAARNELPDNGPIDVPLAVAQFHELFRGFRRCATEFRTIRSWNTYELPGHYAAHQYPDVLVADMRQFFGGLRATAER
jgi:pimeloyl-ACP methyl ester carboxylesterase